LIFRATQIVVIYPVYWLYINLRYQVEQYTLEIISSTEL